MASAERDPYQGGSDGHELTGADCCRLFEWLWTQLSAYMGTPATAALLRRAISAIADGYPYLKDIAITRQRLNYVYSLPDDLCADGHAVPACRALVGEVMGLVGALTGGMLVGRLTQSEELIPWLVKEEDAGT